MTDNEIIKALECCKSPIPMCDDCPVGESDMCFDFLKGYALDIINRQKAKIEELQGTLKFVRGTVARLLETSDKQQAKIEKLKEAYAVYEETTGLKQVRSDAIREFAERLKAVKYQSSDWSRGEHPYVVEEADINEILLEEMTEEKP